MATLLLCATKSYGQAPQDSTTTNPVDCIVSEIVSFERPSALAEKGSESPTPALLWEMPAAATAWGVACIAGTSHFYLDVTQKANQLVREEMQLWRREHAENQTFSFDNYLQYLPLAAVLGLKVAGIESEHDAWQLTMLSAETFAVSSLVVHALKWTVHEWRPDRGSSSSFPSGHTATAFCGAELMRLAYGRSNGWLVATGYTVATATGLMRIYNDRHWLGDVVSGACIGILAADLTYWVNQRIAQRRESRRNMTAYKGNTPNYIL